MTYIDRILIAALVVGVWVLVAVTLTSSSARAEGQDMDRRAVQRIVERCTVDGPVSEDWMYGGSISC
jgi:hypothetical protein